jgi:hypothetical protein
VEHTQYRTGRGKGENYGKIEKPGGSELRARENQEKNIKK